MNIEYISDTGSRHEWQCVHCEVKYVVTYHYFDGNWSVQRIRDDGEREILDRNEAEHLLSEFPRDRALQRTQTDATSAADRPSKVVRLDPESESTQSKGDGPLDLGTDPPKEELDDADSETIQPEA